MVSWLVCVWFGGKKKPGAGGGGSACRVVMVERKGLKWIPAG